MTKPLKDGRFYVSVVCPDGVRRSCICPDLARAHFYEAIYNAGWFNGAPSKPGRKRKQPRRAWNLSHAWQRLVARVLKVVQG